MKFIEWDESFSVGYPDIDIQHKKLFSIINELEAANTANKDKQVIAMLLYELVKYCDYHFKTEERLMENNDPATMQHIKEHKSFIQKITDFHYDFEDDRTTVSSDLLHFLKEWLTDHILNTDQKTLKGV